MSAQPFDTVDLIHLKRDHGTLTTDQVTWLINTYTHGLIADEQMAALLMAIYLNGMTVQETRDLTHAIINTGERLNFDTLTRPTTDKHSTGGVGDKITLPLMPLVASYGAAVPQLSGRGLGHTGGTLDKLESIPGWQAHLTPARMLDILNREGGVVCAAGATLAPADGKLYALRDVTGTVDSIPLIASSIMSKKIAEGTSALVLDVKYGSGAFLQDPNRGRELARLMVELGTGAGVTTRALLTNMNSPLGYTIGNANEVREALDVLAGGGPADIIELTVALAQEMLDAAGIHDVDVAENLRNGKAMDTWNACIRAQGGDPDAALPQPRESHTVYADESGVLLQQEALPFGIAAWRLGAGRTRKDDPVMHAAGIDLHAKPGDTINAGMPLFTLHTDDPSRFERALASLDGAYRIGPASDYVLSGPLILDRITA